MAKTYEELLEQAAIVRDETAAGKNTASRVGGAIADIVEYLENSPLAKDYTPDIAAIQAKNLKQDNRIANAEAVNIKQNERLLNYVYPKLYQLNEGAGALPFDGMYIGSASILSGRKTAAEEGYTYKVVFALGKFLLQEISPGGVTVGLYEEWDKIISGRGSSEDYTRRDCLYYIFVDREGSTYYYIDSNGEVTENSAATYLLRRLYDAQAKEVKSLKADADAGVARNLSLTDNKTLRLLNGQGGKIGAAATLQDKSNLYERSAGTDSVQLMMAKALGGTAEAILGPASTARAGVMTVEHVNKISKLEERVLQYIYPKLYQLNEGAGARPFDGMYSGSASILDGRKTVAEDGFTYKVVFGFQKFLLQEISPGGVTVGLYKEWDKIISGRGSSEDYTRRDCLYYIFVDGEGSTYYYIDSNGEVTENSAATYLLRKLVDKNASSISAARETATAASTAAQEAKTAAENAQSTATAAKTRNDEQDARLEAIENIVSPLSTAGRYWNEANGTPTAAGHYGSLEALRSLPEMLGLGRYLVKDDRTRRKLDPKDSTKYADDGSPAKLDGTEGQCMWCWNGFYANVWKEGDNLFKVVSFERPVGNDISIWIPAGGISWLGAGVIDRGEAPYTDKTKWKLCSIISDPSLYRPEFDAARYRGGGGTKVDISQCPKHPAENTPQITMLGMPATKISTTDFGTYARKRGEGWEANWFVARFVVEFLFEVIMGTENSQEAFNASKDANGLYQGGFGIGVTDIPDWWRYNGSYPVIPTSVGVEAGDGVCLVKYNLPDASGGTYKTFNVPVFFGLVGAGFGHLWQLVRGLIMDAGENQSLVYVTHSMYADYDPTTVEDKIMVAECPRVSGIITRKSYRGLCCMPTSADGSQSIRYSDLFDTSAETSKGLRIRSAGGSTNMGTSAGASYTYANISAAEVRMYGSTPLCYFTEDPKIPRSQSISNNS